GPARAAVRGRAGGRRGAAVRPPGTYTGGMSQTIQLDPADVEYADRRLFPSDPPATSDLLADADELPMDLVGTEPEPVQIRVVERFGLPRRVLVAPVPDEGDGRYR